MLRKVEAGCVGRPEPSFDLLAPPNGSCRARALYYFYWLAPVLQASGRGGYSNFWANGYCPRTIFNVTLLANEKPPEFCICFFPVSAIGLHSFEQRITRSKPESARN